jgi:hypothetical protein
VCTIHQPQQKLFQLFDNLILMKKGQIVYQGSVSKSILFLESIGMSCPPGTNPADHLIDAISQNRRESVVERIDQSANKTVPVNLSLGFERGPFSLKSTQNWFAQFMTLSRRNFQQYWRRKDIIAINIVATLLLSLFIGLGIWHDIGTTQISIPTRVPSLFFCSVSQGVLGKIDLFLFDVITSHLPSTFFIIAILQLLHYVLYQHPFRPLTPSPRSVQ